MSEFNCEYCGNPLEPAEGDTVVKCPACGNRTVVRLPDPGEDTPEESAEEPVSDPGEKTVHRQPSGNGDKKPLSLKKAAFAVLLAILAALFTVLVIVPSSKYSAAVKLYEKGEYRASAEAFARIMDVKDSFRRYSDAATALGDSLLAEGNDVEAAVWYTKAARPLEAEQIFDFNSVVMGYSYITAGISSTGGVYYITDRADDDQFEGLNAVAQMKKFLPLTPGVNGIDPAGRVVLHAVDSASGVYLNDEMRYALEDEENVADMVCDTCAADGTHYIVLLKEDGTVKVLGDTAKPLTSTENWMNVVSLKDGTNKVFGLDYTGRVLIAYESAFPEENRYDLSAFPAVRKTVETGKALVGLTLAGGIAVTYADTEARYPESLTALTGVTDIAANANLLVITFGDGTVKALRIPEWISAKKSSGMGKIDKAAHTVSNWENIVRVRFAADGIFGIAYDGTVRYTSCDVKYNAAKERYVFNSHSDVEKQAEEWTDIVDVISCTSHAVGVKADGTLVSAGGGEYLVKKEGQNGSGLFTYEKRTDGSYTEVSSWKLW